MQKEKFNMFLNCSLLKIKNQFIYIFSAPGSYDVEKSEKIIHQSSGAITFGIKYKEQQPDDIPGIIYLYFFGL